jgi:hypothetical protein
MQNRHLVFYESIGPDQMLVSAREVFARSSDYRGYDLQDPTTSVGLSLELSLLHTNAAATTPKISFYRLSHLCVRL